MEDRIIKLLNSYKAKPTRSWENQTLQSIREYVTIDNVSRNRDMTLTKLNVNTQMSLIVKIVIAVIAALGVGGGTAYVSDSAVPGDILFPVDKLTESVQRAFTFDSVNLAEFEVDVLDERIDELQKLTEAENYEDMDSATTEVEGQQLRVQERVREMEQARTQDQTKAQEQVKVMEKLKSAGEKYNEVMNSTKSSFKNGGKTEEADGLETTITEFSDSLDTSVSNFEETTGLEVQESENNAGTDTQIQNQNQIQNEGSTSGSTGSGNSGTSGNGR